jgi:hypothetical protein
MMSMKSHSACGCEWLGVSVAECAHHRHQWSKDKLQSAAKLHINLIIKKRLKKHAVQCSCCLFSVI